VPDLRLVCLWISLRARPQNYLERRRFWIVIAACPACGLQSSSDLLGQRKKGDVGVVQASLIQHQFQRRKTASFFVPPVLDLPIIVVISIVPIGLLSLKHRTVMAFPTQMHVVKRRQDLHSHLCIMRFGGEVDDEAGRASMDAVCIEDQGSTAPLFDHRPQD